MGVPFFPGHVVKNWDCPGKSGTDGWHHNPRRAPRRVRVGGSHLGSGLGSVARDPQRGPGRFFSCIRIRSEQILEHRRISIWLQKWANRDISGTQSKKRDKWASRNNFFSGTHSYKLGLSWKIQDGWSP